MVTKLVPSHEAQQLDNLNQGASTPPEGANLHVVKGEPKKEEQAIGDIGLMLRAKLVDKLEINLASTQDDIKYFSALSASDYLNRKRRKEACSLTKGAQMKEIKIKEELEQLKEQYMSAIKLVD